MTERTGADPSSKADSWKVTMRAGLLLGACAGAGVSSAALAALEETAQSKVPALGYNVPYAVGNTLLALAGPGLLNLGSSEPSVFSS